MADSNVFSSILGNEEEPDILGSSSVFGKLQSDEEELTPKGSLTFGDYLYDIIQAGPVKGTRTALKALLEIPAGISDTALDTNLVSKLDKFFSEGFFKIPETETTVGDMTALLVQYGLGGGVAAKIAPTVLGLRGTNLFKALDDIPTIAGKAGEIAKRAGYFGGIGGAVDTVFSAPGVNQTFGEQFGLYEPYNDQNLTGREKAVERLKGKLRFGAEGAVLSGALPLLPVAGTLGAKLGLLAGKPIGYVAGNTIRVVDDVVINPIGSVIAGRKIANIDVPKIIPNLIEKIHSTMGTIGEQAEKLLPAKDTPLRRQIDEAVASFKYWFVSNGGVDPKFSNLYNQMMNNADGRAKRAFETLSKLDQTLENGIMKKYRDQFTKGESKQIVQFEQSKLLDYFNTPGNSSLVKRTVKEIDPITKRERTVFVKDKITGEQLWTAKYSENEVTKKILDSLDPIVSKDVKEAAQQMKKYLLDIQAEMRPYMKKKDVTASFMENLGVSFKQSLASFNNGRFAFDPLKYKNVVNFFKEEWLLKSADIRKSVLDRLQPGTKINDTMFSKIEKQKDAYNELLKVNEKNINSFNKKYNLNLDIKEVNDFKKALTNEAEKRAREIKYAAIGTEKDPNIIFNKISEQLGLKGKESLNSLSKIYKKIESLGGKEKTNLSSIVDYLSTPELSEVTLKGKKISVPTSDYTAGILDSILYLNKQEAYRRFFDSIIDVSKNEKDPLKKLIYTKQEAEQLESNRIGLKGIVVNRDQTGRFIFSNPLVDASKAERFFAKPEIINALKGTEEIFSKLYDIPMYGNLMKLKAVAQVGGTIFSPVAQIRNVTGNAFIALVNGLYGGRTSLADSFKIVTQDIFKGAKINPKVFQDKIDDLIRRGIIDQNIQTQELKKLFEQANKGTITLSTFMNNPYVKKAIDIYQGADSGWKIFADSFYQDALGTALKTKNPALLEKGTKAYDDFMKEVKDWYRTVAKQDFVDMNYLTGSLKTPTEIIGDMSSFLVRSTMPTYSQVPRAVRGLRNLPIGNFVSFPAEIIRNSANIIAIGARELTSANPFIRQMGARRLMGAAAGFGGLGYVIKKSAGALTGVTEDKVEAFQRSFAPQYQKNSTLVPVTQVDENGNFKYYNFSYTNPYDSLLRPVNAILNAFADGSLNKDSVDKIVMNALFGNNVSGRTGAIGEFFAPFVDESIGTERVFDVLLRGGIKREGGKVYYPQDDIQTILSKSIQHIAGGVVPGAVKSAQRIWEGATGKFTDAGTIRDMGTEFTAITTGVRIEDAKPLASMPFIVTSYNKDKQNVDRKFAEVAYRPSATVEERLGAYKTYLTEAYDSQNKMYQVLKDGATIGINEGDLKDIVQTRLNNKKETESLFNGTFKVPTYNEKAFDSLIKRLEKEDPRAAIQVENQIDIVKEVYKDMNKEFQNFDLGQPKELVNRLINTILTPNIREIRKQPQTINVLPSSSAPVTPGTPFTYNTPAPSQNVLAVNQQQQQQQQQPQTFGERFALLFPRG